MAYNKRESDPSSALYISLYGDNRKLDPHRIKTYAMYKSLTENVMSANNYVTAASDTNEISVSFKGELQCKVFFFDKVFYNASQDELHILTKSVVQDVIMGLSSFLVICKLESPATLVQTNLSFDMDSTDNISINLLKELLCFTKENVDSSLHVSYFEIHNNKIIDIMRKCDNSHGMKVFEVAEQNCIEIKDLVEKPLIDDKDIFELFANQQSYSSTCTASCCHSVLSMSMVRKNINSDGLEFIKVGKLTLVGFTKCKKSPLADGQNTDDCWLKLAENPKFPASSSNKVLSILKSAFGGTSKSAIIVHLSSVLCSIKSDIRILQLVTEIGKTLTHPEINLRLIIPNSTKECAEEIKELQKDFDATSRGNGIKIDPLLYRSFKNAHSLEDEEIKTLNDQISYLSDAQNSKMQQIINLRTVLESLESKETELQKSSENFKLELEKVKHENNIAQKKFSLKADEVISIKQMRISNECYVKKLKEELIKDNRIYEQLTQDLHCLKKDIRCISYNIDAQCTSGKSSLELVIDDMNNIYLDFQVLKNDLSTKMTDLLDIDIVIERWRQNIQDLVSKFSFFIEEQQRHFDVMKLEIGTLPFHSSQNTVVDIIKNNQNEKSTVLSYYFSKMQVFCDSSLKILSEITHHLDIIESSYKAEFKAKSIVLNSASQALKKNIGDIKYALKSFQQYFEDQEKILLKMVDIIYLHHKFKKQFDEKMRDIKESLLDLKQMYLDCNNVTASKWSEVQKEFHQSIQKHKGLSDLLSLIQREMSDCLDNLPEQKLNKMKCSPLKDKTDNVENRTFQLLQIHNTMKADMGNVVEIHKESIDKILLQVKAYLNLRREEIEKYFDTQILKIKATTSNFHDELRSIHQVSSNNKVKLKKYLNSLSSSVFGIEAIFNKYRLTSNNILDKSARSKIIPSINEDKSGNMLDVDDLFLNEREIKTSTPNIPEKKEFDIIKEKEKFICQIKYVAEQQLSLEQNASNFDFEDTEMKSNVSSVSLPNLKIHSKAPNLCGKKNFKVKGPKK